MANENPRPIGNPEPYATPAARTTDLDTSHAAAASVTGTENLRARLYGMLALRYPGGLTHENIITAYDGYVQVQGWPAATPQGIRSRIKELEREGKVRHDTIATERTRNGRRTHRWYAITDPEEQEVAAAAYVTEQQAKAVDQAQDIVDPGEVRTLPVGDSVPAPSDTDVAELADDIRAARRANRFTAPEMAEYLENRGWRK